MIVCNGSTKAFLSRRFLNLIALLLIPPMVFFVFLPFAWGIRDVHAENSTDVPKWIEPPAFRYSPQGKPDPFHPFINPKPNNAQNEKNRPVESLPVLQRYQLKQFSLVAVLWEPDDPDKSMAMVELPNGKGFVVRENTRIGPPSLQGKIVRISPDKIIVRQVTTNVLGKRKEVNITLKLHKSSGEKND